MSEYKIHNLWPTPVYENNFLIDNDSIDYVKNIDYERMTTGNGFISTDRYLLQHEKLKHIKDKLDFHIDVYTKKFLDIKDNAEFYIQNSWSNKHLPDDWCQPHYHTGSLISGVYYLDVPENSGDLVFQRMSSHVNLFHSTINIEYNNANYINDDLQEINVKNGDILLFPSHVMHKIRPNLSNLPRYSLAFNYFVKGKFGTKEFELEIK
tara:strand:+ start:2575 stop:3198 length:624 start_codon:yes stop_codon:yes gene_type:complete